MMKKATLLLFILSFLFLSGCSRGKTLDEKYNDLLEDYANEVSAREEAETRYNVLRENVNKIYDDFLALYFYFQGTDETDFETAKEYATFIHDYLDRIRP